MTTEIRSIGDKIAVRRAAGPGALTAGGTGDNTAVTGIIIDRAALGWPASCVVALPYTTALGEGNTLSLAATLQDGEDSGLSDAATYAAISTGVIATGGTGGSTVTGQVEVNVNLAGAGRYLRLNYTPDLNRANTDTALVAAVIAFGGANRLPQ
jgi:hypothetical protein